jgi:hypothetical protein
MAASQKTTWEAPSLAELPKLLSPTTNRIWVRTRSRRPSSRLSPAGALEGIAHYSGCSTGLPNGGPLYPSISGVIDVVYG